MTHYECTPHTHIRRHFFHLLQGLITLQQNLMTTLEMEGDTNLLLMTTADYENSKIVAIFLWCDQPK